MRVTFDTASSQFFIGGVEAPEFFRVAVEKSGKSISSIETSAGLDHPTLSRIIKGESKSIRSILIALEALGYDLWVTR